MIEVGDLVAYKPDRCNMKAEGVGLVVAESEPAQYAKKNYPNSQCFIVEWLVVPYDFSETNICLGDLLEKLND